MVILLLSLVAFLDCAASLSVSPSNLVIDEDWPMEKPLPVEICSKKFSDIHIVSGNEAAYFSIILKNSTCATLQLKKSLDADILHSDGRRWQGFIFVFEGRRHHQMSLEIQIADVNDNAPEFVDTAARISVAEIVPVNTVVSTVKTFDPDTGIGGIVQFFIQLIRANNGHGQRNKSRILYRLETNPHFEINLSGFVVLTRSLRNRTSDFFELIVTATELRTNEVISEGKIKIRVIEKDKYSPQCSQFIYYMEYDKKTKKLLGDKNILRVFDEDTDINYSTFSLELEGLLANVVMISSETVIGEADISFTITNDQELADKNELTLWLRVPNNTQTDGFCKIIIEPLKQQNRKTYLESSPKLAPLFMMTTENSGADIICDLKHNYGLNLSKGCPFWLTSAEHKHIFSIDANCVLRSLQSVDREERSEYHLNAKVLAETNLNDVNITIRVLDENDNAPQFTDHGTEFLAVEGETSTFTIHSGEIVINPFDAESLSNLIFPVIITASDNGSPSRSNTTMIMIRVQDVNDNSPEFKMVNYSFNITNAERPGAEVGQVEAEDFDISGNNVTYTGSDNHFKVNKVSGTIELRKPLPRSVQFHDFEVKASDSGIPSRSTVVSVRIVNGAHEIFTPTVERIIAVERQDIGHVVYLPEHETSELDYRYSQRQPTHNVFHVDEKTGSVILERWFNASNLTVDIDVTNTHTNDVIRKGDNNVIIILSYVPHIEHLIFTAISATTKLNPTIQTTPVKENTEINVADPYRLLEMKENKSLVLAKTINDNRTNFVEGKLIPERVHGDNTDSQMYVEVPSENNNRPRCPNNISIKLTQGSHIGSVLGLPVPLCTDNNSGQHDRLQYSITIQNKFFKINSTSSEISVVQELPPTSFSFVVTVMDSAGRVPSHSIDIPVFVDVAPTNLHPPEFEPIENITITGSEPNGSTIYNFKVFDKDGDSYNVSLQSNATLPFVVDSEGALKLSKDSNLVAGEICAKVVAADAGIPRKVTEKDFCVTVVGDTNMDPVILWPGQNSNQKFDELLIINATVSPILKGANRSLHYRIVGEGGVEDQKGFVVDNDGRVRRNVPFNFEERQNYQMHIEVCDVEEHCTQIKLFIQVIDENDNCPFFQQQSSIFKVHENVAVGETGIVIGEFAAAVDLDTSPEHRAICYELSTPYSFFLPDRTVPILYLNQSLDREVTEQLQIVIQAKDCNTYNKTCVDPNFNSARSDHIVIIHVLDKNDNFPKFDKRYYHLGAIVGHVRPGEKIASVCAKDSDLEENGLRYLLIGPVRRDNTPLDITPFEISEYTGDITTSMEFRDAEAHSYTLRVGVSDSVGHTDETFVIISVLTYNQQAEFLFNVTSKKVVQEIECISGLISTATSFQAVVDSVRAQQDNTHVFVHFLDKDHNVAFVADALAAINTSWSEDAVSARNILETKFGLRNVRMLSSTTVRLLTISDMLPISLGSLMIILAVMMNITDTRSDQN
uniref:Cadherin domain-containing protein n=1 Tax=Steinernema glaseri TaxID=37863 RepID=A0A1I7YEN6_9BILA